MYGYQRLDRPARIADPPLDPDDISSRSPPVSGVPAVERGLAAAYRDRANAVPAARPGQPGDRGHTDM